MKLATFLALGLLLAGVAHASTITFTWTAVTQFTDGTTIPSTDAITYSIRQGTLGSISTLLDSQIATSGVSEPLDLTKGSCFTMTAVVAGIESAPSVPFCLNETPASVTNLQGKANP